MSDFVGIRQGLTLDLVLDPVDAVDDVTVDFYIDLSVRQ